MALITKDIAVAASYIQKGELVGMPTETVYGLAGNALDEDAIFSIFKTKNRPHFDPLIVHLHSLDQLQKYVNEIPEKALLLAKHFWPGPLTLLLEKKSIIPDLVTSGLNTVAVRIPNHPVAKALLEKTGLPLAAPSANPFGYISPTTAEHVNKQLGDKIPCILDGGECSVGIESTIVGFENDEAVIYRLGGLSAEDIESVIGKVKVQAHSSSNPQAPGMLKSHYAPRKTFVLGNKESLLEKYRDQNPAVLNFSTLSKAISPEKQLILSASANIDEAARNLFSSLRHLDGLDVGLIIAEPVPDRGLGKAINDRLLRASAEKEEGFS